MHTPGPFSLILPVHIVSGVLGIATGFVALYTVKGGWLHRQSGMVFVYTMLTVAILGAGIAAVWNKQPASNVPVGVLTAYMVFTGFTTVRPLSPGYRWLDVLGLAVALAVGLTLMTFGLEALVSPGGAKYGVPAFPLLLFGTIRLLATAGDVRVMRSGALHGAPRLARHLWRMCFALGLAAFAFVPRLAPMLPARFRSLPVLVLPVLIVLLTMLYWLWRVRFRPAGVTFLRYIAAGIALRRPVSSASK